MAMLAYRPSGWHELLTAADAWQLRRSGFASGALHERYLSWLSPDERARYERFRTEQLRRDYLSARVLCRSTLSRYASVHPSEWKFASGMHGKPRIAAPDGFDSLHFNLTHTRDLVICLVSRAGEVGVDAEKTSLNVDGELIVRHFFSRSERARFTRLPLQERAAWLFAQWVLKEAYLKGTGKGLDAPERVTVEWGRDGQPLAIGSWQLSLHYPSPHHVAAAAVARQHGASPIAIHWLETEEFLGFDVA